MPSGSHAVQAKAGHLFKRRMCQHRFVLSAVIGSRQHHECCRDAGWA
jgi:hypothetical protein